MSQANGNNNFTKCVSAAVYEIDPYLLTCLSFILEHLRWVRLFVISHMIRKLMNDEL
jgi:hypothetical protein